MIEQVTNATLELRDQIEKLFPEGVLVIVAVAGPSDDEPRFAAVSAHYTAPTPQDLADMLPLVEIELNTLYKLLEGHPIKSSAFQLLPSKKDSH